MIEKRAKKQLKKIRNRKSGIRNRKSTILPLVIRKAGHTFATVGRINAEEKEAVSVDAEVTIWKTRCTKRNGSTVNLTNSIYKLKKTKNNANYEQLDTGSHEVCEPDGRFRF